MADLEALNDQLRGSHQARGFKGSLGRVAEDPKKTVFADPFAAFRKEAAKRKWQPAGEDPLYKRFTRGPVIENEDKPEADPEAARPSRAEAGGANGVSDGAAAWRRLIDKALRDAGGAMPWDQLRDEVVSRWRRKHGGGADANWQHL